jgi:signal transduction histidine kinase
LQTTFQEITYPDDIDNDIHLVQSIELGERQSFTVDKRIKSKYKKLISVALTVSLVRNSDRTPKFYILQVIDITDKKALESELLRKNGELEAIQISLTDKLNQLEQLNHIIGHNLRGHSGNIKMFVDRLLIDDATTDVSEEILTREEALEFLEQSTNSLTDNLETMVQITQIKLNTEIAYDLCNVDDIITSVCIQLQGTIYTKQATIIKEIAINEISYPRVYLESILYNFISNALKYSHPDRPPVITVATKQQENGVVISVKDNGLGIDLYTYGDKLFKLNKTFHKGYDSRGIGLFMTKTQVEMLGGSISVKSKEGEGSEFIVLINQ